MTSLPLFRALCRAGGSAGGTASWPPTRSDLLATERPEQGSGGVQVGPTAGQGSRVLPPECAAGGGTAQAMARENGGFGTPILVRAGVTFAATRRETERSHQR